MKKPVIVCLTYANYIRDLESLVEVRYHNCTMDEGDFYDKCRGADLIIEQEFNDGKAIYGSLLEKVHVPKAVWLIDTHVQSRHPAYARYFDYVFVAINRLMPIFDRPTFHLPLGCPMNSDQFNPLCSEKKWDVAFVGQFHPMGQRRSTLQRLAHDLNLKQLSYNFTTAYGPDYERIYRQSKLGFNKSIAEECNFRVFEVIGMGVPLVTDWNDECGHITGLRERIFPYNDFPDILLQIEHILGMPEKEIENLCINNQQWLKGKHLVFHRFLEMIKVCIGYTPPNGPS